MDKEIINIADGKKGILFKVSQGYNVIMSEMISFAATEYLREKGECAYVISKFWKDGRSEEITRGYIPGKNFSAAMLLAEQKKLKAMLENEKLSAFDSCKSVVNHYQYAIDNSAIIFCKCGSNDTTEAVMGAAWYSKYGTTRKSQIMCTYLLYAMGWINPGVDSTLWEATYRYLVYETGAAEPEDFDKIILEAMKSRFPDNSKS